MMDELTRLTMQARRDGAVRRSTLALALRDACQIKDQPSTHELIAGWDGEAWQLRDDQPVTVRADLLRLLADILEGNIKMQVGASKDLSCQKWLLMVSAAHWVERYRQAIERLRRISQEPVNGSSIEIACGKASQRLNFTGDSVEFVPSDVAEQRRLDDEARESSWLKRRAPLKYDSGRVGAGTLRDWYYKFF